MSVKEVLNRIRDRFRRISRSVRQKLGGQRGYVMILVAFALPLLFMGVQYVVKKTHLGQRYLVRTNAINRLGDSIIRAYNPSIGFDEQKDIIYAAAANTLNDSAFKLFKEMLLEEANNAENIQVYRNIVSIAKEDKPASRVLYELSLKQLRNSSDPKIRDILSDEFSAQRLLAGYDFVDSVQLEGDTYHITYFSTKPQDGQEPVSTQLFRPYTELPGVLSISLKEQEREIVGRSEKINREVIAHLPECNANIIIAIPTNHDACCRETISDMTVSEVANKNSERKLTAGKRVVTKISNSVAPISIMAKACGEFVSENFAHTYGIAIGIVPYSGKVSLDPEVANERTCDLKPFELLKVESVMRTTSSSGEATGALNNKDDITYSYWKQAAAYSTAGKEGAILDENNKYDSEKGKKIEIDEWNGDKIGTGIMYRRGMEKKWNTLTLYTGGNGENGTGSLLLSNEAPENENLKYMRMPLNPCYLGHCNLTGNICEKTCPKYMENPYYIYELTDNITEITYYLKFFVPFEDKYNKSNFVFLPLHWAGNLLASWTKYPTSGNGKLAHPDRSKKRNFVVIIINKPSTFEPHEMTYLGFDNDNAEMPISESDVIAFKQDAKSLDIEEVNKKTEWNSNKQLIKIQKLNGSSWEFSEAEGGLRCSGHFKLIFANKNLISLKLKDAISRVKILEDNRPKGENIGTHLMVADTTFKFSGPKNFVSESGVVLTSDTRNIYNFSTTGGMNFGHNLGTKKLKYKLEGAKVKDAILSHQVLRNYAHYKYNSHEANILPDIILNEEGHSGGSIGDTTAEKYSDPCIGSKWDNQFTNAFKFNTSKPQLAQVLAYNFHPLCYGMRRGYFVMTAYIPNSGMDMSDGFITQQGKNGTWPRLSRNSNVTGQIDKSSQNAYQVYSLIPEPDSSVDYVRVFTGRVHRIANCKIWAYYTPLLLNTKRKGGLVANENIATNQTKKITLPYSRISKTRSLEKYYYETNDKDCKVIGAKASNVLGIFYPHISFISDKGAKFSQEDKHYITNFEYSMTANLNTKIDAQATIYGNKKKFLFWKYYRYYWDNIGLYANDKILSGISVNIFSSWFWIFRSYSTITLNLGISGVYLSRGGYAGFWYISGKRAGTFNKVMLTRDSNSNSLDLNYVKINNVEETANVTSTSIIDKPGYSGDISYFGRGTTEVTAQAKELSYQYHLNNFFFINTDKKNVCKVLDLSKNEYICKIFDKDKDNNDLWANKGIYLDEAEEGDGNKSGWLRFCGDGYLNLTFGPDPDSKFVMLEDIQDLDFDKLGINRNEGIGESLCQKNVKRLINSETEIFIIPEQVAVYDEEEKNYSVTVHIQNCILKEVGISNKPYYLVTPEVQMFGALPATPVNINMKDGSSCQQDEITMEVMRDKGPEFSNATDSSKVQLWRKDNGQVSIKIAALKETNRLGYAVFKTNVKKAFKIKAYVPIGWFDSEARLDWREDTTTGSNKLTLYTNYSDQEIPVQLEVTSPYMGDLSPTLSIIDENRSEEKDQNSSDISCNGLITDTRYWEGDPPKCTIDSQHKISSVKIQGFKQYLKRAYYGFTANYSPYKAYTEGGVGNSKLVEHTISNPEYKKMPSTFPKTYSNDYTDSVGISWYNKLENWDGSWNDGEKDIQHIYGKGYDSDSTYDSGILKNLATDRLTEQYNASTADKRSALAQAQNDFDKAKSAMEQSLAASKDEATREINAAKREYETIVRDAVSEHNSTRLTSYSVDDWINWTPEEDFTYPGSSLLKPKTFSSDFNKAIKHAQEEYKNKKDEGDAQDKYKEAVTDAVNDYNNSRPTSLNINDWINWNPSSEYDYPSTVWDAGKKIKKAQEDYKKVYENNKDPRADADKIDAYNAAKEKLEEAQKEYDDASEKPKEEANKQWDKYTNFEASKTDVADNLSKIRFFDKSTSGSQYTDASYSFQIGKSEQSEEGSDPDVDKDTEIVAENFSLTEYEKDISNNYAYSDVWAKSYEALKIRHNYIKNCKLKYGLNDICNGKGESISGVFTISATPSHDRCDVDVSSVDEDSPSSIYSQKDQAIFQITERPSCQRKYVPIRSQDVGNIGEDGAENPDNTNAVQYDISAYIKGYTFKETENGTEIEYSTSGGSSEVSGNGKEVELDEDKRPESAYKDYNEKGDVIATYIPVVDSSTGELTGEKVGEEASEGNSTGVSEDDMAGGGDSPAVADEKPSAVAEGKSVVDLDPEPSELITLCVAYEQDVKKNMASSGDNNTGTELESSDWEGAFGGYYYKEIQLPKNLFMLKVSGDIIYNNGGQIDGISIPASPKPEIAKDAVLADETEIKNSQENTETTTENTKTEEPEYIINDSNEEIPQEPVAYTDITPPTTQNSDGTYSKDLDVINCYIGSRVERDGVIDCTVINQGHNADETEIEISPTNYDFQDIGDGWYIVIVPCENVIISEAEMLDKAKTLQVHGYDFGEAVQLVDFENSSAVVGAIREDIRDGSNNAWLYQQIAEAKFWCLQPVKLEEKDELDTLDLSPSSSRFFAKFIESYIDTDNQIITATNDFFAEFWDYEMVAPGLSIKFGEYAPSEILETEYGNYKTLSSFGGSPLLFFPYNTYSIGNNGSKFVFSGTGIPMAAVYAGFTMPYNFALASNGYQSSKGAQATVEPYPSEALKKLAQDACEKLDATVYVIKYGEGAKDAVELDQCKNVISYTADNETELRETLREIAQDIKEKSDYTSGYTEINLLKEREAAN